MIPGIVAGAAVVPPITLNPSDKSATITLSNGNLTAEKTSGGLGHVLVRATVGKAAGKWYWEVVQNTTMTNSRAISSFIQSTAPLNDYPGSTVDGWSYNGINGLRYNNGAGTAYGATFNTGDVIGVALNLDDGEVTFYKNNASQGLITGIASATWFPSVGLFDQSGRASIRFTAASQSYSPPSGFSPYDS